MAKRKDPAKGIRLHGRSYELNFQRAGKRYWINLETEDFAEAVVRAAAARANPELQPATGFLAEIERFIAHKKRMNEYTEHTARTKRNKLKLLAVTYPKESASTITAKHLQRWHDGLLSDGLSPTTVHGYFMSLRAFFNWSIRPANLRRTNPVNDVQIVESLGRARADFCDYDLRDRLIANAPDEEMRFILLCGFHAGLRFREIVEARPFWFDLRARQINLRKTPTMQFKDREERSIPLTIQFHAFLESYGLRQPFMLRPGIKHGQWLYRYDFRTAFMSYMKAQGCDGESGIRVTPHTMRHTFASLLVSAGESIYKVAVWMGDEVATVQKHYGHLAPDHGGIEKAFSRRGDSHAAS